MQISNYVSYAKLANNNLRCANITNRAKAIPFNWIIVLCLIYVPLVTFSPILNKIALFVIIPLLFIYCLYSYSALIYNKYIQLYIAIVLWILISCFVASDIDLMLRELRIILGTFAVSCIFFALAQNKRYVPWLYLTFLLVVLINYVYLKNNILTDLYIGQERPDDELFNANRFGYYLLYSVCAIFVYGEIFKGFKETLCRIFLFAFIAIVPYIALITMSRQIIIIVIPFCLYTLIQRYNPLSSVKHFIIYGALLAIVSYCVLNYYLPLYESSIFIDRLQTDVTEDNRVTLIIEGFLIGLQNPILGVGPGNAVLYLNGYFTHCSYTELFATSGLLPMVLFIALIGKFIFEQLSRYRQTKDKLFLYFFTTGVFWAAYNFFYVFYSSLWLMCFLFLLIAHSGEYYKELNMKESQGMAT